MTQFSIKVINYLSQTNIKNNTTWNLRKVIKKSQDFWYIGCPFIKGFIAYKIDLYI